MARRMFSDEITNSDAFLDMGKGSQLLYFHLGMAADDDGFIGSPKMIMRVIGASDDEYKLLVLKKFIIHFQKGICVIKHWRINNQIRKDRYRETKYLPERSTLYIRENGAYTLNERDAVRLPKGHFLTSGDPLATTRQPLGAVGKVRIGKVSKEDTFEAFWKLFPNRRKGGKKTPKKRWDNLDDGTQALILQDLPVRVAKHKDWLKNNGDFIPAPEVYLNKEQWLMPIVEAEAVKEAPSQKVDRFNVKS